MREQAIRAAAALLGVKAQQDPPNSQGWMSVGCPFAPYTHASGFDRNPSMRVLVSEGGRSHWKCWSCAQGGDLTMILHDLNQRGAKLPYAQLVDLAIGEGDELTFPTLQADAPPPEPPPVIPEQWLGSTLPLPPLCIGADYIRSRGFNEDDWEPWDVRWDPVDQRVCWPVRDADGVLRGLQGRTIHANTKPKYLHYEYKGKARGSDFFLGEHRISFDKPIVLVEGAMDCMGVSRAYPNVVAAMGASSILRAEKLDRLATAFAVIPFFDGNKAGQLGAEVVKRWCLKKRLCVPVHAPPGRDPGDLHEDNIGELLGEALAQITAFV